MITFLTSCDIRAAVPRSPKTPLTIEVEQLDKRKRGGALLNLSGETAVAEGYERILDNVRHSNPAARIDGVVVAPMRGRGNELFVSVARDPQWGLALVVALGGVWVEALEDSSLRVLPMTPAEIKEMFLELRAARLLQGYRGAPPVDLDAVAGVVAKIAAAAAALGPALVSLEVNPLYVGFDGCIECLDALAVWS
jgi:hypothetical protein